MLPYRPRDFVLGNLFHKKVNGDTFTKKDVQRGLRKLRRNTRTRQIQKKKASTQKEKKKEAEKDQIIIRPTAVSFGDPLGREAGSGHEGFAPGLAHRETQLMETAGQIDISEAACRRLESRLLVPEGDDPAGSALTASIPPLPPPPAAVDCVLPLVDD